MQFLALTLLFLVVMFLSIFLFSMWIAGMISGGYYDQKLQEHGMAKPIVIPVGCSRKCARAIAYLFLIITNGNPFIRTTWKWYPKSFADNYKKLFGDIDYRRLARKRDWVLAIVLWGSGLLCSFFTFLTCVLAVYLHFTGSH
jgi:hypothetical protein